MERGEGKRIIKAPKPYMTPERLIEEVRIRPPLWDESLKAYMDREKKKKLWSEIASLFVGGSRKFDFLIAICEVIYVKFILIV